MTSEEQHSAALAVLQESTPPALFRFAMEVMSSPTLDAVTAAMVVGRPGQAKEMLLDQRVQRIMSTLGGQLRETYRGAREQMILLTLHVAAFDIAQSLDQDGEYLHPMRMAPEVRAAIEQYEKLPDGRARIKWCKRVDYVRLFLELMGDLENTNTPGVTGSTKVSFYGRESADE